MKFIASYRRTAAHIIDDQDKPICGAEINPKFWGYIPRSQILDFMSDEEKARRRKSFISWRKSFHLCWFCKRLRSNNNG